ncbi:alpha/beta fold hydrolase [Snuella sedimenti]|uniref:Alpha/beta hydrolase n=1 Tax=Snuella sedimenti TaxID=2798802 RepID=A0A8J7LPR9_9FLAO|nr:alpha/beta fold hydrolase [Snuella sedimenti]MBJ6369748.1 alpha/beta hydrolase [Snuella sedimenti]
MIEKLIFKTYKNNNKEIRLCIHLHYSKTPNKKAFLFINPLFDEKKRSQKFQATTARALAIRGFNVVRFDFFGTGDSYGNFQELSVRTCLENSKSLLSFIREELDISDVYVLGIRWGASIALELASTETEINKLILIDPIISGKRYLTELRLRRKAFFMLNNMKDIQEVQHLDGEPYEDHQGFLLSPYFIKELEEFNLLNGSASDKSVVLFSLDTLNYKKLIKLKSALSLNNKTVLIQDETRTFWNNLEIIKTEGLTEKILENV